VLDAKDEENSEGMCNIDHEAASPNTIHTAVLSKPSLIDANINSAITAMLDIVQPKNDDVNEDETYDEVLPHEKYARNQPIIPVSRESNEPIVEWTDNKTSLSSAFLDKFLFGQGVPNRLPTQQSWKHFSLYYDGRFDDLLFIAHGFNQLQHACCICISARITGKPGYFEKSWCVGQFRGILKTSNLGTRSSSLPRDKAPQCKGLLNSFNGGIHDSIQSF
jgi:hypothetical protein